jgi:hypothetical protein
MYGCVFTLALTQAVTIQLDLRSPSPRPSPPGRGRNFGTIPEFRLPVDSIQRKEINGFMRLLKLGSLNAGCYA